MSILVVPTIIIFGSNTCSGSEEIPSLKPLQHYGKSPCLMGKSTIHGNSRILKGEFQDPIDGGMLVPYSWPYFGWVYFLTQALHRPYIW